MIILRQKNYGLTDDGGGTSSMNFYKDPNVKAQQMAALKAYKTAGGRSGLGQSFDEFKKTYFTGPNLSEQKSNLVNDKSSYRGSSLVAGQQNNGKPNVVNNRLSAQEASRQAAQGAQARATQRQANQAFAKNNPNVFKDVATKARTQGYNAGVQAGKTQVGIKQGAINTWNGMSQNQKIAAGVIGGAAVLGTGMMIARNRKKRKEAERELELERARNRR